MELKRTLISTFFALVLALCAACPFLLGSCASPKSIAEAARGDLVEFGSWEQDGDVGDGAEPIEWVVLDKVDGRLLLLSEACLDGRPYNPVAFEPVTWEECALRSWLATTFFENAFSPEERSAVCEVENANLDRIGSADEDEEMYDVIESGGDNRDKLGKGGAPTRDRVFLLSETDANVYLHSDQDRMATGKAQLVRAASARQVRADDGGNVGWWLRSPGVYGFTAQFVDAGGAPYTAGANVELEYGVRPAIWIDVSGFAEAAGGSGAGR